MFATGSSALRPGAWSRACAPARYIAMPSIAYRLARVAAGDGVATVSIHGVNEYDVAAGMALVRAAGGVAARRRGQGGRAHRRARQRLSGCFAGAPPPRRSSRHDWKSLENEPPQKARVALGFPRRTPPERLDRAQACLLGQVIGDSLGSLVEFKSAAEIARLYPQGVRALADGGVYHTIAGQPTDDSEMALALARCLVAERQFVPDKVLDAYREWLTSRPVDIGATTERGLLGMHTTESESNGSLMRVSPIGVWAAGDPARAARGARGLGAHAPEPGVRRGVRRVMPPRSRSASRAAAARRCARRRSPIRGPAREAISAASRRPIYHMGWALVVALQNAFYHLERSPFEEALIATVAAGGDTDTNAAICGALLGAALGRPAIPSRWILPVLACRSTSRPAPRARARGLLARRHPGARRSAASVKRIFLARCWRSAAPPAVSRVVDFHSDIRFARSGELRYRAHHARGRRPHAVAASGATTGRRT